MFEVFPFFLLVQVPSIHVLADHNAIDPHIPHLRGTVSAGFELVIDFLPLVGAFDGRAAFVDELPLFRSSDALGEEP